MPSKQKAGKVNLQHIADRAGVGIATVDRVLNERGNVSSATTNKVLNAAREMQLKRHLPESYYKAVRIEVLLARPELPLIDRMNQEFKRLSRSIDRSVFIHRKILRNERPETIAAAIKETSGNAVIVYAQEHEVVHQAIERNLALNIQTVTIISDLPNALRLANVGIDNRKAGRTAAYFVSNMSPPGSKFLILCNHLGFHGHSERVRGFLDFLTENRPDLSVVEVIEGFDDDARSHVGLSQALAKHAHIAAIYNTGAANGAVFSVLKPLAKESRPLFVGHELTDETRQMLKSGIMTMVIDQNPEMQALWAVEVILNRLGFAGTAKRDESGQIRVPFTLYSPENIIE